MPVSKTRQVLSIAKISAYFAGALLLLVIAFLAFSQSGNSSWFKNIRAEVTNQPYARTVTVEAEGKISAQPDIAYVDLSVAVTGSTVAEVTEEANSKMAVIIDGLKGLGVEREDIKTTQYNLWPRYNDRKPRPENELEIADQEPQIVGYQINQTVQVKVRDLSIVDQVVDSGTKNGANQVGSLRFDIDEASEFKDQAREIAFEKAREKAEKMADAAGVKLGRVVTFSEGYNAFPMRGMANFALDEAAVSVASAPAIEPGSQDLTINVSVTYEID